MVDVARRRVGRGRGGTGGLPGAAQVQVVAGRLLRGVDGIARKAPVPFGLALLGAGVLIGYWTRSRRR